MAKGGKMKRRKITEIMQEAEENFKKTPIINILLGKENIHLVHSTKIQWAADKYKYYSHF